jgi:hypothetical protein
LKMKMQGILRCLAALCCFLLCTYSVVAQDLGDIYGLSGLKSCGVTVRIDENSKTAGINEAETQALIELKLRQNGIAIGPTNSPPACMYLILTAHPLDSERVVFRMGIHLRQTASLQRNQDLIWPITWEMGTTGIAAKERLRSKIRDEIESALTQFLNEFYTWNPR